VDEVLAVGDTEFQERCMAKFAQFREEGRTVVVVSHGLEQMRTFCDEAAWLDHGVLQDVGEAASLIDTYTAKVRGAQMREDGGLAFGSGEATIDRIEILNGAGEPCRTFHTGDEMSLRIHYTAHQELERPVFGASIDNIQGDVMWGLHGLDANFQPERIQPGPGSVDIHIPRLMLRPNSYEVASAIQPPHLSTVIAALQKSVGFDVVPGPGMESGGVMALGADFRNLRPEAPLADSPVRDEPLSEA